VPGRPSPRGHRPLKRRATRPDLTSTSARTAAITLVRVSLDERRRESRIFRKGRSAGLGRVWLGPVGGDVSLRTGRRVDRGVAPGETAEFRKGLEAFPGFAAGYGLAAAGLFVITARSGLGVGDGMLERSPASRQAGSRRRGP
jgi:hypothetical protein